MITSEDFQLDRPMPEIPVQVQEPVEWGGSDDVGYPMYNVLVFSEMAGSIKKLLDGVAVDLSKTKWGTTADS